MKRILTLLFCSSILLFGESWNRILEEYVGGILLAGAYSGSVNYSKPFWVDIDNDNDYDFFIGGEHGGLHYYRNDGTTSSPDWTFITEFYQSIDIDNRSSEAFVDIDNDGDYDLFLGEQDGNINYYRNDGTPASAVFIFVTDNYAGANVGSYSAPIFCDIDDDNDYDLFIGSHDGTITYYRNDGTSSVPTWTFVSDTWFAIDIGVRSIPWFADIDADNDYDLFVGCADGTVWFYRNAGTPAVPNMVYVTNNYTADVGNTSAPSFVDIDNDGDLDLFIGEYIGNVNWYRNTGNASSPSWSFVRRHYVDIDMNSSCTPTLVDIDNDGDKDLFAGEWVGLIDYYQNSGTAANHQWTMISENYDSIDVGDNSVPTFVKIDGDNDYDMFIGNLLGNVYYYRNDGNVTTPDFTLVSSNYNSIDVGDFAAPVFVDIDNDGDKDLFVGCLNGTIWYYRNDGSSSTPSWTFVSNNYSGIDVGERSIPRFADLDNDGDFDLFIGEAFGTTYHYRNTGTPSNPSFTLVTSALGGIDVEENTCPDFADIDADGDLDLFIGERWGGLNLYEQIVTDNIPPQKPYITSVTKTFNNVRLCWRKVTTDTLGNVENMKSYTVYRNTSPNFVPGSADSIGFVNHPDTVFTNVGVLNSTQSYYYLVKAVDAAGNRSRVSNMGFKFNKFYNENTGATSDRNWVSLPWHNNYSVVNDLVNDLSVSGNPLVIVTNMRNDQLYESYVWDQEFGWYGDNYAITPGRAYEMVTVRDTTLWLVGADNPNGLVALNENPGAVSDRNLVSVPYNAIYSTVSGITGEYSPAGDPLIILTNMRNDQLYESYIWDQDFGWYGTNFTMERGRAYEFVAVRDTSWNPAQYTNETYQMLAWKPHNRQSETVVRPGQNLASKRSPLRATADGVGVSHIIAARYDISGFDDVIFTVYRREKPADILTEEIVGCGLVGRGALGGLWFNVGNFKSAWHDGEEALLIVEARKQGKGYIGIKNFKLDKGVDLQALGKIELCAGNSSYDGKADDRCTAEDGQSSSIPVAYSLMATPNPFGKKAQISYALPARSAIVMSVYDPTGRQVKTLVEGMLEPGYYTCAWDGRDDAGRILSTGVYFVVLTTGQGKYAEKVILQR